MNEDSTAMGTAFTQWQQLTDDYATALQSLQRGNTNASATLARIAQEMQRFRGTAAPDMERAAPERPVSARWASRSATTLREMFGRLRVLRRNALRP